MAVLADEGVDKAALAGIGPTHHGKAGYTLLYQFAAAHLQFFHHQVEQVARTASSGGADAVGLTESQLVELGGIIALHVVVHLVGHKQHGELGFAQYHGHIAVPVGHTVGHVHHEEHQVGLFGGYHHLLADFLLEHIVRVDHPPSGVDHGEFLAAPLTLAVLAVACGAGLLAHNGAARLGEPVEECRLAHIGASYYCY